MHLYYKIGQLTESLSIDIASLVTSSVDRLLTVGCLTIAALALLVTACGGVAGNDLASHDAEDTEAGENRNWDVAYVDAQAKWLPVLATQDLAVGVKRVAFSIDGLSADEEPPLVRVSLYALDEDADTPRSVQFARFIPYDPGGGIAAHGHVNASVSDRALPVGRGVYVVPVRLDTSGLWGMRIEMTSPQAQETVRLRFSVRPRQAAPSVGEQAPLVASRTRADVDSLAELTSDPNPEPGLYAISIDEALRRRRPLLLTFATPAFCHSRTCAPVLDAVKSVWREFSDRVNGIHVEVFENPQQPARLVESAAFDAWRLPSEPWVFIVDGDGIIRYAFEGAVTEAALRSAVEWVTQDEG